MASVSPTPSSADERVSVVSVLRAMARNYKPGQHSWDHLDAAACVQAADEIDRLRASLGATQVPIDMILHCPKCGLQHVDAPERMRTTGAYQSAKMTLANSVETWGNPPHRSHLCHDCGFIWRPADVATNGVAAIKTAGKNDSPAGAAQVPSPDVLRGVVEMAREAHAHWDADRDSKVGKILLALAGFSERYDKRSDALHAALSQPSPPATAAKDTA